MGSLSTNVGIPPLPSGGPAQLVGSISAAARAIRQKALTCEELVVNCLDRIEALEPTLNAFITITRDEAIATARKRDQELRGGRDRGPLHGIPIVYKDNIKTAAVRTTVGSRFLGDNVPAEDAAIVRRLNDAGSVMLGKSNMSEFASGSSGSNPFYGDVHNPWDLHRSPGGSSSGTGVAVSAGFCLAGIGTDSGGSIRQPASRLNIFGLRPTLGRVDLTGVYPRTRTLGAAGPMTSTAWDAAIVLNALLGTDAAPANRWDPLGRDVARELELGIRGVRVATIADFSFENVESEVEAALLKAIDCLANLGAQIQVVQVPVLTQLDYDSLFANVLLYEFNEILGPEYRSAPKRSELFGPAVQRDIERGVNVPRATYERIIRERPDQVDEFKRVFEHVDVLLTPTLPNVPPLQSSGPEVWARGRQFNLPFSFLGVPAISVPCGFAAGSLPLGMQLIANHGQEELLLRVAAAFDSITGLSSRRPPLSARPATAGIGESFRSTLPAQ